MKMIMWPLTPSQFISVERNWAAQMLRILRRKDRAKARERWHAMYSDTRMAA